MCSLLCLQHYQYAQHIDISGCVAHVYYATRCALLVALDHLSALLRCTQECLSQQLYKQMVGGAVCRRPTGYKADYVLNVLQCFEYSHCVLPVSGSLICSALKRNTSEACAAVLAALRFQHQAREPYKDTTCITSPGSCSPRDVGAACQQAGTPSAQDR